MAPMRLPNLSALTLAPGPAMLTPGPAMLPRRQSGTWREEVLPAPAPAPEPEAPPCDKETDGNPDCRCPKCEANKRDAADADDDAPYS